MIKKVIDDFKGDIQIEYEVNDTDKIFRVTSLNPIGQRIIHEEFSAPHSNHKKISLNYGYCLDIYNKLISQYYGKFHNRAKESTKE